MDSLNKTGPTVFRKCKEEDDPRSSSRTDAPLPLSKRTQSRPPTEGGPDPNRTHSHAIICDYIQNEPGQSAMPLAAAWYFHSRLLNSCPGPTKHLPSPHPCRNDGSENHRNTNPRGPNSSCHPLDVRCPQTPLAYSSWNLLTLSLLWM